MSIVPIVWLAFLPSLRTLFSLCLSVCLSLTLCFYIIRSFFSCFLLTLRLQYKSTVSLGCQPKILVPVGFISVAYKLKYFCVNFFLNITIESV